jgi:hypothetical protein
MRAERLSKHSATAGRSSRAAAVQLAGDVRVGSSQIAQPDFGGVQRVQLDERVDHRLAGPDPGARGHRVDLPRQIAKCVPRAELHHVEVGAGDFRVRAEGQGPRDRYRRRRERRDDLELAAHIVSLGQGLPGGRTSQDHAASVPGFDGVGEIRGAARETDPLERSTQIGDVGGEPGLDGLAVNPLELRLPGHVASVPSLSATGRLRFGLRQAAEEPANP